MASTLCTLNSNIRVTRGGILGRRQNLIPLLLESLNNLPLHAKTLDVLNDKVTSTNMESSLNDIIFPMSDMVYEYERALNRGPKTEQYKPLEALIYHAHFIWENPLPTHLKSFLKHYEELLMFWPYEHHRSLLSMDNPKKSSIRYRWNDNHKNVLTMMQFKKNPWLTYHNENNVEADITKALGLETGKNKKQNTTSKTACNGSLTHSERDLIFHSIFNHYYFLKVNPRLCQNGKKLPIPVVEIPMRPLGEDIAAVRIKNLFKRKVANTWRILATENPALSKQNEQLLSEIISESKSRKLSRLYQRACKRAYLIEEDNSDGETGTLLKFEASPLLLGNI